MRNRVSLLAGFVAVVILCAIDSFTKKLASAFLKDKDDIVIIPKVLVLRYLENTGAAFGLFKGMSVIFIILSIAVCFYIVFTLLRMQADKRFLPLRIDLFVLMAGAIGNLIDRIRMGYVVDFIYFKLIDFPIFNVADIYVTVSIAVLVLLLLFYYKDDDFEQITGRQI